MLGHVAWVLRGGAGTQGESGALPARGTGLNLDSRHFFCGEAGPEGMGNALESCPHGKANKAALSTWVGNCMLSGI